MFGLTPSCTTLDIFDLGGFTVVERERGDESPSASMQFCPLCNAPKLLKEQLLVLHSTAMTTGNSVLKAATYCLIGSAQSRIRQRHLDLTYCALDREFPNQGEEDDYILSASSINPMDTPPKKNHTQC